MFSFGFGAFIFLTVSVLSITVALYYSNKVDTTAKVRMHEIDLERDKLSTERAKIRFEEGKLKAKGEFVEE